MYIFIEQLEVRGKSLQGGANQLLRVRTQHLAISSHKRMLQPANTRSGLVFPSKARGKTAPGTGLPPAPSWDSALPRGGKASLPIQDAGHVKNLVFSKAVFSEGLWDHKNGAHPASRKT